jgi:hypothetical protein
MTILTGQKKKKITKLLAATWFDMTFGLSEESVQDIETMGMLISNLAGIAVEVGGMKMAKAVADLYDELHRQVCEMEGKDV